MRIVTLIMWGLMALAPGSVVAQGQETAVRADVARTEIERILNADNLDGNRLSPREIADTISGIERGRAPEDFWCAYQQHVEAWQRFAGAIELAQRQQAESTFIDGLEELEQAEAAIGTTFAEVTAIARRYGARLPVPPVDVRSIA